jgi:hypothetical protein
MTDIRGLLRALRAAGWDHTRRWQFGERDLDGAAIGEDLLVHEWTRGDELISAVSVEGQQFKYHVLYAPLGSDSFDMGDITVGIQWIEERGLAALARLAGVLGVFAEPSGAVATR